MVRGSESDLPLRVLVADDEPDVRLLLRLGLVHHNIVVIGEAGDGFEVLSHCEQRPPDAIVLDLLMPKMNGFEVIPKIREQHPQVGIVAYTAVAGDFVRKEMDRLGVTLVLKSGDAAPLADALFDAAARQRSEGSASS